MSQHQFDRSGLGLLSDLYAPAVRELFKEMEKQQTAFLAREADFRSGKYKWPRDPLHTWSRCWEYPYVYYHLRKWREAQTCCQPPHVVDVGSGVTFFPFAVAQLDCRITCTDNDPVCGSELMNAARFVPHSPGEVEFRITDGVKLPFADGETDAVYCISVLEHIPNFERTVEEMARILKPSGALFLTIDLDLRGDSEIGIEHHRMLKEMLEERFEYLYPTTTAHPADLLTSANGPYPVQEPEGPRRAWFLLKQQVKVVLGRQRSPLLPFQLCVEGLAIGKKQVPSGRM